MAKDWAEQNLEGLIYKVLLFRKTGALEIEKEYTWADLLDKETKTVTGISRFEVKWTELEWNAFQNMLKKMCVPFEIIDEKNIEEFIVELL